VKPFTVRLNFHGDLDFFLAPRTRGWSIERNLSEKTSVKDVVESCGVPHTEVDLILVNTEPVDFGKVLGNEADLEIYPIDSTRLTFFHEKRLQVLDIQMFVADGHLGKLVRDLRLVGIDVAHNPTAEDRQLVKVAASENRALLTRDRRLLMHAAVRHGYYLRSQNPLEQTVEVLRRFDVRDALTPFSRCLRCNTLLQPAEKAEVIGQLKPLTKIYYEKFRRCPGCRQIYWSGSHFEKLQRRIETIRSRLSDENSE
jgi:uncharacterized protein with PIN domain